MKNPNNGPDKKITEEDKDLFLYVDDEEASLRYFSDAFGEEYGIITADDAEEAWDAVQKFGDSLYIIITDQRMPGKQGVELLKMVHRDYPTITRLLTTAYTDLDSAIASVNEGFIYHYISKPWDEDFLRITLKKSVDYCHFLRDKDILIREKISTLQRMIIADKVKSLSFMAAGISHHIRYALNAMASFTDKMLNHLEVPFIDDRANLQILDCINEGLAAQVTIEEIQKMTQRILMATEHSHQFSFKDVVDIGTLLNIAKRDVMERFPNPDSKATFTLSIASGLPPLYSDKKILKKLFVLLMRSMVDSLGSHNDITIKVMPGKIWETKGCQVNLLAKNRTWDEEQMQSMFAVFNTASNRRNASLDLLTAYFIVYHHGGDIKIINDKKKENAGFQITLASDPQNVKVPILREDFLQKVITHFEEDNIAAF